MSHRWLWTGTAWLASGLASCAGLPLEGEQSPQVVAYPTPEGIEQLRTNTGYVLDQGEVEVELVTSYGDNRRGRVWTAGLEVEYGLTPSLMAEVEIPFRHVDPQQAPAATGIGNVELEAKLSLFRGERVAAALGAAIESPTGDRTDGLGSGLWETELFTAVSLQAIDWASSLHLQGGVEFEESEGLEDFLFNAAFEHHLAGELPTLQIGANSEFGEGNSGVSLIPGLEFEVELDGPAEFEVGIGFPVGLTRESENWGVIIDFEVEF